MTVLVKVTLIGVTHIDKESQIRVEKNIHRIRPDAVCLELDEYRLQALLENEELSVNDASKSLEREAKERKEGAHIKQSNNYILEDNNRTQSDVGDDWLLPEAPGFYSSILEEIGFFESELAEMLQMEQPGKEMIIAYKAAKEIGAEVYLVDQSIMEISEILEKEVPKEEADEFQGMVDEVLFKKRINYELKEESNLLKDKEEEECTEENEQKLGLNKDLEGEDHFHILDRQGEINENHEEETLDLNNVLEIFKDEESLADILTVFRQSFPKLYSVLLHDRNDFIIKKILEVIKKHNNIIIILGYGHIMDIAQILQKQEGNLEIEIIK
ncbi:MAG: hypothetical protein GF308_14305 [Candidatus Heimdallarchaeota archaeon]|nr:hypothetical protein [Candidatus Heimdallarchaeota archaeon]